MQSNPKRLISVKYLVSLCVWSKITREEIANLEDVRWKGSHWRSWTLCCVKIFSKQLSVKLGAKPVKEGCKFRQLGISLVCEIMIELNRWDKPNTQMTTHLQISVMFQHCSQLVKVFLHWHLGEFTDRLPPPTQRVKPFWFSGEQTRVSLHTRRRNTDDAGVFVRARCYVVMRWLHFLCLINPLNGYRMI